MITTHICHDGEVRAGDEFDCGFCRARLLEAFRSAPAPRPPGPVLQVPGLPGRTVEADPYAPEALDALDTHGTVHTTVASTTPFQAQPGGAWRALCSCGWSRAGIYRHEGRDWATGLVRRHAEAHRKNPEEDL